MVPQEVKEINMLYYVAVTVTVDATNPSHATAIVYEALKHTELEATVLDQAIPAWSNGED